MRRRSTSRTTRCAAAHGGPAAGSRVAQPRPARPAATVLTRYPPCLAAQDDEDEEDEDEDEEGVDGQGADEGEPYDSKAVERENRRLDADRRKAEEDKLEGEVRDKYENRPEADMYDDEDYGDDSRFTDLPDAQRDPKLWLLKCKPGCERMLIISLMQKYLDAAEAGTPLSIKAALCTEIKGYVYVEAFKETHVREATQGLNGLFYRITQVPAREMTDVMRVRSAEKKALVPGAWVRMRRNDNYKDDLGQVLDLDVDGTRARVRLVPRLDAYLGEDEGAVKRRVRPPAKLFDAEALRARGEDVGSAQRGGRGRAVYYYDNQEFEEGFLIRNVSIKGLKWDGVSPTTSELDRFKAALGPEADLELLTVSEKGGIFRVGDAVKVVEGDLKHLVGVVTDVSSDGKTVTMLPDHAKLRANGPIALSADLLAKFFKMGDHVKVIGGSHHLGETGMVVRVGASDRPDDIASKGASSANATVLFILTDLGQQVGED